MTTANMLLALPVEGPAGSVDVWGGLLNSIFGLIDAHDHTTGKGVKVPSAGLNINADVSWSSGGSNYSITDMKAVDFAPQATTAVTALASALFVNSSDANNLYFRNQSGTNVKLTDGSTLNVSIVGGIGGDYSSVSALLDYDDATDTYRLRQETSAAVRQYAKVAHADLKLFEYKAAGNAVVPPNAVTMKSPAGLAASYSVTLPAAVPASTLAVQMSSAGALSTSNTFSDYGNSTARYLYVSAGAAQTTATGPTLAANGNGWSLFTSTGRLIYPVDLHYGDTIQSYQVGIVKTSVTGTITARLYKYNFATQVETALGTGVTQTVTSTGILLQESGLAISLTNSAEFYYVVVTGGGTTGDAAYHALISYTRTV
jgi:hypothetical protein